MKNKTNLIKIVALILLVVIISVSATYAFFQIRLIDIESASTVSVAGAELKLKYEGRNEITANYVQPGWSDTKYFNVEVTNKSSKSISYYINLQVLNSNFYTTASNDKGYLQYKLKKCTDENDKICTEVLVNTAIVDVQKRGIKRITEITTNATSEKNYYALEISYPDTGYIQSQRGENGEILHFSGNVTISSFANTEEPKYFEIDSWSTIASFVNTWKEESTDIYPVGATKEVSIDGKDYTVRIANNSNYDCTLDSKTACGFVVEFVDIITGYNMNPAGTYNGTYYEYGTNLGGWPSSAMYKYINGDTTDHLTYKDANDVTQATLYSKLPIDLRNVIADTKVISGHGASDKNTARTDENWESTDKLYLLSTGEIYSNCLTENCYDTASYPYNGSGATTTRQLDYYNGVTTSANYERAIKQQGGSNRWWWLRGAHATTSNTFRTVNTDGSINTYNASVSGGVAPAFRIA